MQPLETLEEAMAKVTELCWEQSPKVDVCKLQGSGTVYVWHDRLSVLSRWSRHRAGENLYVSVKESCLA